MTDIVYQVEAVSLLTTGGAMYLFLGAVSQCCQRGRADFIIVGKVPRLYTSGTNCCFFSVQHQTYPQCVCSFNTPQDKLNLNPLCNYVFIYFT